MPKRTNEFQKLVFYFKKHTIKNVTITESKELDDKQTGNKREVESAFHLNIFNETTPVHLPGLDNFMYNCNIRQPLPF